MTSSSTSDDNVEIFNVVLADDQVSRCPDFEEFLPVLVDACEGGEISRRRELREDNLLDFLCEGVKRQHLAGMEAARQMMGNGMGREEICR